MPILEMPTVESLIAELKERKVRDVRLNNIYVTAPDQAYGTVTQFRIVVSAFDKTVIRYTDFTAIFPTNNKEAADAGLKKTQEREAEIRKTLDKAKLTVKTGEWKE